MYLNGDKEEKEIKFNSENEHDKEDLKAQQSILQRKHDIMVETLCSIRAMNKCNLNSTESNDTDLYKNPKFVAKNMSKAMIVSHDLRMMSVQMPFIRIALCLCWSNIMIVKYVEMIIFACEAKIKEI